MQENEIGTIVLELAIAVHQELGPGLLETIYEAVLAKELQDRGLTVSRQVSVPIEYKGIRFDEGFWADLVVDDKVILELKSVERVATAHKKQVQTYLRLTGCKLGYLSKMRNTSSRNTRPMSEKEFVECKREFSLGANLMASFHGKRVAVLFCLSRMQ